MDRRAAAWTDGPRIAELGEFGLIARIRKRTAGATPTPTVSRTVSSLRLGPGDDAALLSVPRGWDLVLTCDIQLEGHHFLRRSMSPREVGARAATVNLSDVAAMGGVPAAALVSLGLPLDLPVRAVDELCDGLMEVLARHGATLAGGNITAAGSLIVDVTLIGQVEEGKALRRSGARIGDTVFVTGWPGRAAAALATLDADEALWARLAADLGVPEAASLRERFRLHHAAPEARVAVGRFLVENQAASAAIDVSDGLGGDSRHLAEESGVRIVLEETFLPVDPDLAALAALLEVDPLRWVVGASDDYEMLFAAPRDRADLVLAMGTVLGAPVTPIGRVTEGAPGAMLQRRDGTRIELEAGWDHLSPDRGA
jgi:thiamine-monophosphate kinase